MKIYALLGVYEANSTVVCLILHGMLCVAGQCV